MVGPGLNRKFRLTSTSEFRRVRRNGKSYAHPLVVLVVSPNQRESSRFGFSAGRAIGGAVRRNRAKRRMREAMRTLKPSIKGGWDMILIARSGQNEAEWSDLRDSIEDLLRRAKLIQDHS